MNSNIRPSLVSLLIAALFFLGFVDSANAMTGRSTWVNPIWQNVVYPAPATPHDGSRDARSLQTAFSYTEFKEALWSQLETRTTAFSIRLIYNFDFSDVGDIINAAFKEIESEDGYTGGNLHSRSLSWSGHDNDVTIEFAMTYVTTYSQEQAITQRVAEIIAEIISPSMTDEEKAKVIHDWVVLNVEYDQTYQHHSAYDALFEAKETVCQGYTLLMIRMLQDVNIESKFVGGTAKGVNHSWNLVHLCGHWYHLDATWDDQVTYLPNPDFISWDYYLLSDAEILVDHSFDAAAYPDAPDSYVEGVCSVVGDKLTWLTSAEDAVSAARTQGKMILMIAGSDSCPFTTHMRDTVCEKADLPIKDRIRTAYVPWFSDVDAGSEWGPYASGLEPFTLPLICRIDPADADHYLDWTTGPQEADEFYARLLKGLPLKGDLNGNAMLDLGDAVLALKIVSGAAVSAHLEADVDGDKRIGIEEAVYIMGMLSR